MGSLFFRNRFRIPSARRPQWDYSRGMYCVTICTQDRVCWLGQVVDGEMIPSDFGSIVAQEWLEMARRRPNVELDAWCVMPNHFHGILRLKPPPVEGRRMHLGEAVGHFKGACSRRIWAGGTLAFAWQPRFFDQIVRNEAILQRFRRYIAENPRRWQEDRHHPTAPPLPGMRGARETVQTGDGGTGEKP